MDSEEYREQLKHLHTSAFGWAMVCCGRDRELAADIVQQAYCRILAGEASFAGKSKFVTWVFGVIRLVALEELRSQQRQQALLGCEERSGPTDVSTARRDEGIAEQRELAEQLSVALEKLSDRQRAVLHLTFYESMTIEQAADVMEISIGSARQHYHRGKVALRNILSTNRELDQ